MSEYDKYQDLLDFFTTEGNIVVNLFGQMISLGISIFMIVIYWFLFQKANQPGWAAVIPYYNSYIVFKIAGKKKMFWGWLDRFEYAAIPVWAVPAAGADAAAVWQSAVPAAAV